MGRFTAIVLALFGAGVAGLAVWLLPQSKDAASYNLTLAVGFFFGACGLVGLSFVLPVRVPPADASGAIVIPNSKFRTILIALALFAIAAAGVFGWPAMASDDDWRKYIFLVLPIPCGMIGLYYLWSTFSGRPAYRFDREGVTRYQWGERTIPWSAVTGIRRVQIGRTQHVVIDVTPAYRHTSGGLRLPGDITLPPGASGLTHGQIEALALQFWQRR